MNEREVELTELRWETKKRGRGSEKRRVGDLKTRDTRRGSETGNEQKERD